jgi:hypothetical protein
MGQQGDDGGWGIVVCFNTLSFVDMLHNRNLVESKKMSQQCNGKVQQSWVLTGFNKRVMQVCADIMGP